jgi:outer membrane protein assembly factor BamB
MKKIIILIITILLISQGSIFALQKSINDNEYDKGSKIEISTNQSKVTGSRHDIKGWIYVQIKGAPYERGYQYGYLISEEIIDLMTRWSNMIHNHPKIKPLNDILTQVQYDKISSIWWNFCTNLAEKMYWDEYPEEYKEEMKGIAAGITDNGGTIHGNPPSYKDVLASNQMYEMMSKLTDRKLRKGVHPLLSLYNALKPEISTYIALSQLDFFEAFSNDYPLHHHCSSFIATGDATNDGQLIISNSMWSTVEGGGMFWWSHYIALRWNIVLDVIPANGYRFQMTCAPGYIWSDHDFYQNNAGIVFIETTLPQGLWTEKGWPLAVRARLAVQYAESIDDVIDYLWTNNDGVMNAVWLIGDTKTGEICRYEQGLYKRAVIERTFNGFQWSANNPIDLGVRLEKLDWRIYLKRMFYYVFLGEDGYEYYTPKYYPAPRDLKFQEFGENNYGEIDINLVKEIMSTEPICKFSPDCKITSTKTVENNGMWIHTGNPSGKELQMGIFGQPETYYETILPVGWLRFYGLPDIYGFTTSEKQDSIINTAEVEWTIELEEERNDYIVNSIVIEDIMYSTSSNGYLHAINLNNHNLLFSKYISEKPTKPVFNNNKLFIGTQDGLKMLDLGWMIIGEKQIDNIVSDPIIIDDKIYVGNNQGMLYCYDADTGYENWNLKLNGEIYISNPFLNSIYVASEDKCYCINFSNGEINWVYDTDGIISMRPLATNDSVYIGSWDANLYSLDANTGELKWKYLTGWGIETTPVIHDDLILFGSHDNNFYALDKNQGTTIWIYNADSAIHASPIIHNNNVIFGSDDGHIYALEISSGDPIWNYAPGRILENSQTNYFTTPICSNLISYENTVCFGSLGKIYAISD